MESNHLGTSLLAGYSRAPYRSGNNPIWWAVQDSNLHITSLEDAATANCANGPIDYRSRYRNRKGMVWAAGFEPATTRFQSADSGLTELHPVSEGRGSGGVFMNVLGCAGRSLTDYLRVMSPAG